VTEWADPEADAAREALGTAWPGAEIALVLGSGLGGAAGGARVRAEAWYGEVPGLGACTAPGHAGRLLRATLCGREIAVFQGRRHLYEGIPMAQAGFPARLARALGARLLVLFSAVGSWVFVEDHINLMGRNPLEGVRTGQGPAFVDLAKTYRSDLSRPLRDRCAQRNVALEPGILAAFPGPTYETPAEVRMARTLGASVVGMSTVPEAVWARFLEMDVVAFGRVTNPAAGIASGPIDHGDVLRRCEEGTREASVLLEETVKLWTVKRA